MCTIYRDGDALIFEAPELERAIAYLSLRGLAERIEEGGGRIRATPYIEGVEDSLKSLCSAMPSDLRIDLLEALLGDGWIADRSLSKMRKIVTLRDHVMVLECDCARGLLRVFSTADCGDLLRRYGVEARSFKIGVEGEGRIKGLVDALILADSLAQEAGSC